MLTGLLFVRLIKKGGVYETETLHCIIFRNGPADGFL